MNYTPLDMDKLLIGYVLDKKLSAAIGITVVNVIIFVISFFI